MAEWPFTRGGIWKAFGIDATTSLSQVITAGGSNNTKSSWAQLGSSTLAYAAKACMVALGGNGTAGRQFAIDIGIGTSGNEKVLYGDLGYGAAGNEQGRNYLLLPCNLPAGTQINVRSQANTASSTTQVACYFLHSGLFPAVMGDTVTSYGMTVSAATNGVSVDGSTANNWGSWTTIVASTTYHHKGLLPYMSYHDSSTNNINCVWEIAVGGAGAEKVLMRFNGCIQGTTEMHFPMVLGPFACSIPAGSTIRMRMQGDNATNDLSEWGLLGIS